jgi:hypothetical protein
MRCPLSFLPAKPIHQSDERHQVCEAKQSAPLSESNLYIWARLIGPLHRNYPSRRLIEFQQKPSPVARVTLAHAREQPIPIGMERMRDPHKRCRRVGECCISR